MSARRRTPSTEELDLWRLAVRDAVPLKRKDASGPAKGPAPAVPPSAAPPPAPAALPAMPTPAPVPRPPSAVIPPPLLGAKSGIDRRTDERVKRGRLPIDGRLDLHGLTQAEAHDALLGFVRRSYALERRLLLVITGKGALTRGEGILKSAVPRWLNEAAFRPMVLAVHPAQPQHGGAGALYVFLKRKREG